MKMSSRPQSHKALPKRQKNRLTEDQLRLLEESFSQDKKLEPERKFHLAYQLGMPAKQVAIWYQNRRARWKTQNIEGDFRTIQLRLESSLAAKGQLQNEVGRLRAELQKAQQLIFSLNFSSPLPVSSSLSSSSEENSSNSSSMPVDVSCHWQSNESWQSRESWQSTESWQNNGSWQVEDVYACLLGEGEQTSMMNNSSNFFNP
ncbi:hypothetical protein ACHQM5_003327 [Ranunculus cassubicifolius]